MVSGKSKSLPRAKQIERCEVVGFGRYTRVLSIYELYIKKALLCLLEGHTLPI